MQIDGQRLGPVGLQVLRALLALGAGLLLVTAWLLPGRGPSSLSAPPAPTVTPQSCSGMWCRPHRDQRACIHSAALAWPWDTYPTVEFIGMRRTQSCFGEPDFDGPKEVVHRCTGPVVFNADHPVYQQEGSDEADTGGFCCVHIATVNVVLPDLRPQAGRLPHRLGADEPAGAKRQRDGAPSEPRPAAPAAPAHHPPAPSQTGTRHTCGLSGAFGASERSITFSFSESAVAASSVGMRPAVTCPNRILHGLLDFATGAGVVLLFMCLILSRSNPIG
eukprot:scaffold9098_cov124-Isochrysis_galbana.AAC.5